ncbi:ferrochelatase [Actinomadura darangshiensis]|uniref:Coproporphyrin III ferrochelatase n=1 Tax=Actinomadura darangshiensis TaxID=705336 RepID=A0A4R5BV91_9ACTN|nr:ferrochelatase [Actinomadura darangshiensis]TDD89626.1 ferrochelatase [Actinomadura darangshiensis]
MADPTAVVMLSMGEPNDLDDVRRYFSALLMDRELMQLPMQKRLSPLMARMSAPGARRQHAEVGGPRLKGWLERQGEAMVRALDDLSPATAPHRHYLALRYSDPSTDATLRRMKADGVRRAVAMPQFPQFSCTTSGSSLNELWRGVERTGLHSAFTWSVLDRWYRHPAYVASMAETVRAGLADFDAGDRDRVLLLFSAHSMPMKVINKGDPYPHEIHASVDAIMDELDVPNAYRVSFQSKVGPVPWLGPSTIAAVEKLAGQGVTKVLVVCVAFTSDHIETLYEIDVDLFRRAEAAGIREIRRAPAPNVRPAFVTALAEIVAGHLKSGEAASAQYPVQCLGCDNALCRTVVHSVAGGYDTTEPTATLR